MLATPLFTPLLLSSQTSAGNAELYLISDSPQLYLSQLLDELNTLGFVSGRTFTQSLSQNATLGKALEQNGWILAPADSSAHVSISSSRLQTQTFPSFTLAKEGRIWDLRNHKLLSLWKEMRHQSPSSLLTTVSLKATPLKQLSGESVSLYKGGKKVKTLSLKHDTTRSFLAPKGRITVKIERGSAKVIESSCSTKICTHCPPASIAGERIICAPNHFLLEVNGASSVDTIIG